MPGYTWAPAWVSWRYGDGYCGWAPLPPDSFVGVDYYGDGFALGLGFHIGGDCDGFYGIGAGWYSFLPVSCLGYRNYHGYYRHRSENYALINHTTNVTNLNITRSGAGTTGARGFTHVTTGGPMLAQVNAVSQMPVQRVKPRPHQSTGWGRNADGEFAGLVCAAREFRYNGATRPRLHGFHSGGDDQSRHRHHPASGGKFPGWLPPMPRSRRSSRPISRKAGRPRAQKWSRIARPSSRSCAHR